MEDEVKPAPFIHFHSKRWGSCLVGGEVKRVFFGFFFFFFFFFFWVFFFFLGFFFFFFFGFFFFFFSCRMEDLSFLKNLDDCRTRRFIRRCNRKDQAFAKKIGLKTIRDELKAAMKEQEALPPWSERDGFTYQFAYLEGREYEVLLRNGRVVLDFEAACAPLDKSFESGSLNIGSVEPYGNFCIVGLNFTGEPFFDARIYDFVTGTFLPEVLRNTDDFEWLPDGQSFVYTVVEPERNWPFLVKLHRKKEKITPKKELKFLLIGLGTHALDDLVVYQERDERFVVSIASSLCGSSVFVGASLDGHQDEWRLLSSDGMSTKMLLERGPGVRARPEILNNGPVFLLSASPTFFNGQVVQRDASGGETVLLAHDPAFWLRGLALAPGFVVVERVQVSSLAEQLLVLCLKDRSRDFVADLGMESSLPHWIELAADFSSAARPVVRYFAGDLLHPQRVFELNLEMGKTRLIHEKAMPVGYDPNDFEARFEWAVARDGTTRVPIALVWKRGRVHSESPMLLHGYAAYGDVSVFLFLLFFFFLLFFLKGRTVFVSLVFSSSAPPRIWSWSCAGQRVFCTRAAMVRPGAGSSQTKLSHGRGGCGYSPGQKRPL
jgi:protease II